MNRIQILLKELETASYLAEWCVRHEREVGANVATGNVERLERSILDEFNALTREVELLKQEIGTHKLMRNALVGEVDRAKATMDIVLRYYDSGDYKADANPLYVVTERVRKSLMEMDGNPFLKMYGLYIVFDEEQK